MKSWAMLTGLVLLAGCEPPRQIVATSTTPQSIQLFVRGANLVPLQEVEDRALGHCAHYGMLARQTQTEWIDASAVTFQFECRKPSSLSLNKLATRKMAEGPVATPRAPVLKLPTDRKQAAWRQAHLISSGWARCIFDGATRAAQASSEPAEIAAIAVAGNCAQWEHHVHEVLRQANENDDEFQVVLHRQIIEFAADRIVSVRGTQVQKSAPSVSSASASAD